MRIGEILIGHGWVDRTALARALAEQRLTGKRICSLLVARGALDPDHAARALAEQHDVAAILQHHLAKRDRALPSLLPAGLARSHCALPVGRLASGALIVCVRDPDPARTAAIMRAVGDTVVIAVAPATQLEELIDLAYEPVPEVDESVDVDLTTGPIAIPDLGFGALTLVELDDARVAKDPTQSAASGQFGAARRQAITRPPVDTSAPAAAPRGTPSAITTALASGSGAMPQHLLTLQDTIAAIEEADRRAEALEIAMRFVAGRWSSSLLVAIRGNTAYGVRGHGRLLATEQAVRGVIVPLDAPSAIRTVHATRRLITEPPPPGSVQEEVSRVLGDPRWPMAAPISTGTLVAGVLVVGDTLLGDDSEADLALVAVTLGTAYARCPW
ncbi:MAG: hypothetical protein KF773_10765 [Deltaproteobacteria bacterium]|nr:hypothetical protein [Deltaproteobacteria bacterium]